MIPQDLFYGFPAAAYLLLFLTLIILLFWGLYHAREKALNSFLSKDNLKLLLNPRPKSLYLTKAIIFCFVWLLATFALMEPKGNGHYLKGEKVKQEKGLNSLKKLKAHDLIFLIDASASMSINDSPSQKTRLEFAKEIVDEIASELKGENASLYAFTSVATKMSPPTPDLFFVRMMLRQISINEGAVPGTDIYISLKKIGERYFKPSKLKLTTLIMLSDGGDTKLTSTTGENRENALNQILGLVSNPESLNLRVFTIGMGSSTDEIIPDVQYQGKPVYSKLESEVLKRLSEKGRGSYYEANNQTPFNIAKDLFKQMSQDDAYLKDDLNDKPAPKELLIYQLFYQIPLALSLILLSLYIIFPNVSIFSKFKTLSFVICCLNLPILNASQDLLKNAKYFFEAGDYGRSEALYAEMLQQNLNNFEKAVVMYNQGTALLKNEDLQKSVQVFELIGISGNPPPFLIRRIKTNLSLAKYKKALLLLPSDSQNILEKAAYLLKSSQSEAHAAKKAACELQKIEGRQECNLPQDLKELLFAIDGQLKELSKKIDLEQLFSTSDEQLKNELQQFSNKISKNYNEAIKLKSTNLKELNIILEKAIEMEHETLLMTRKLSHLSDFEVEVFDAIKDAQNQTIKVADHYLKAVYALQLHLFETSQYQKKPWNEILPLYNKGYQAAIEAYNLISENLSQHLEDASFKQEETIKYWKEILRKSEDESLKTNETKLSNSDESKQNNNEKALELLQEMQNADRQPAQSIKTLKQEVEKPW